VKKLQTAFRSGLQGNIQPLLALGVSRQDIGRLQGFRLPSDASIQKSARALGLNPVDLRDFLEVFMIRVKTAVATRS
jgi:hypothetical protein